MIKNIMLPKNMILKSKQIYDMIRSKSHKNVTGGRGRQMLPTPPKLDLKPVSKSEGLKISEHKTTKGLPSI